MNLTYTIDHFTSLKIMAVPTSNNLYLGDTSEKPGQERRGHAFVYAD